MSETKELKRAGIQLTDLIINMMKASKEDLQKMPIEKVAAKYHAKPEDVRFLRDHELNNK